MFPPVIILLFNNRESFSFRIHSQSETSIEGFFTWDSEVEARLRATDSWVEDHTPDWYLNDEGDRLPMPLLFEKSHWSLKSGSIKRKILIRLTNYETGEAWFNIGPVNP